MATKSKADGIIPLDAGRAIPAEAPGEATRAGFPVETVVTQAAPEPEPEPAPAREPDIADIVSTPLAAIEDAAETAADAFSASVEFDASAWARASLDLWAENAAALLDFAERLAKARSFGEAADIQTRFAADRFEAFVRQTKELMEIARAMATVTAAPLCETRKAA